MNAYAIAIGISLLVYIAVGNYAGRRIKHLDDYFVAGRNAPTFLIVGTLAASVVSTNTFLGDVGFAYSGYAAALIMQTSLSLGGYVIGALFFGRYIRRARAVTVSEFFGRRFGSRRVRIFSALTVIVGIGGYLMAVTQGIALVVSAVTELPFTVTLVAVWLGYTAFTIYSGSRGVVITDTIMFLLFATVGVLAVFLIASGAGGWTESVKALATSSERPGIISASGFQGQGALWDSPADMWIWAAILGVSWAVVFAISPWQSSRYLMARNEHVIIRSACVTILLMSVVWSVVYFSGPLISLLNPDIVPANTAMIWAATNAMPTAVGATLLAGIVAAGLSSASTFLTLIGFAISNDVLPGGKADEAYRLRLSRLTILAVGFLTLVLAVVIPPRVFWITNFVGPMFAAIWGPVAFFSVWSRTITEAGAFWGLVAGFIGYLVPKSLLTLGIIGLPAWADPLVLGFAASLAAIRIVSNRGAISAAEREYRDALHVPPAELTDPRAARLTTMWPRILIGWGAILCLVVVVAYVRPYQVATGHIPADSAGVALSAELLLALLFGAMISAAGITAYWAMRRFYA